MKNKTFNIVLVDDHVVVRNGLKELIELMGPYKVSMQFDNGRDLLDALPFKRPPDLVIMDLNMPILNGFETVKRLQESEAKFPILVLTLNTSDPVIIPLFKMGIRGYLEKECTAQSLSKAIEDILTTGYHHNELLAQALVQDSKLAAKDDRAEILSQMTSRELEFLKLVCHEDEYTYEQMRHLMGVSLRTIDGYRESLFEKFGIKSKAGLVLFAVRYHIL